MDIVSVLYLRHTTDLSFPGGADRVVWDIVQRILQSNNYFPLPVFILNKKNGSENNVLCDKLNNIKYYCLFGKRFYDHNILTFLKELVLKNNIRIIHSNDYKTNFIALLLKKFFPKIIIISTVHGYISNSRKTKLYNYLDKLFLLMFDHVITVNSKMKESFPRFIQKKTSVIFNGIDEQYWQRTHKKSLDKIVVGFAGRISVEKGWNEFLQIAESINAITDTVYFHLAGDGPDFTIMKSRASQLKCSSRIKILGHTTDMKSFYESIDILCAPSHTEGFPMVLLEANAMSIPVVATNVGGVPELVIDGLNGFLVNFGDIPRLVHAVTTLTNNPEMIITMGTKARNHVVANFSVRRTLERYGNVYDSF